MKIDITAEEIFKLKMKAEENCTKEVYCQHLGYVFGEPMELRIVIDKRLDSKQHLSEFENE